jgi:hypothetical protein
MLIHAEKSRGEDQTTTQSPESDWKLTEIMCSCLVLEESFDWSGK